MVISYISQTFQAVKDVRFTILCPTLKFNKTELRILQDVIL